MTSLVLESLRDELENPIDKQLREVVENTIKDIEPDMPFSLLEMVWFSEGDNGIPPHRVGDHQD